MAWRMLPGITGGCAAGKFCPGDPLTLGAAAVFFVKAKHGAAFVPPAATGVFTDVPTSTTLAPFVELLEREGLATGCGT